jgi:putative PIN family toxin of toxin-antitoxin system
MRIVLDANVIVSAVITPNGNSAEILRLWEQEKFDLVVSIPVLEEVRKVLHYPKIQTKYNITPECIGQVIALLSTGIVVEPVEQLAVIQKDPADNRYLECARAGDASYIITGDIHLLELKEYQDIYILTPANFLALTNYEETHR